MNIKNLKLFSSIKNLTSKTKKNLVKIASVVSTLTIVGALPIGLSACSNKANKNDGVMPSNSVTDGVEPTTEKATEKVTENKNEKDKVNKNDDDKANDITDDNNKVDKNTNGMGKYNIQFNEDYKDLVKNKGSEDSSIDKVAESDVISDSNNSKDGGYVAQGGLQSSQQNDGYVADGSKPANNGTSGNGTSNGPIYATKEDEDLINQGDVITSFIPDDEIQEPDWGGLYYDPNEDVAYEDEDSYNDYVDSQDDGYVYVDGIPFLNQEEADKYKQGFESVDSSYTSSDVEYHANYWTEEGYFESSSAYEDYMRNSYTSSYVDENGNTYYFTDEDTKNLLLGLGFEPGKTNSSEMFIPNEEVVEEEFIPSQPKEEEKEETPSEEQPKEEEKVETPSEEQPKEEEKVETPSEEQPKEEEKVETPSEEQPKEEEPKQDDNAQTTPDDQIIDGGSGSSNGTYVVPNDPMYGSFAGTEWVSKEDFDLVWQCLQEEASELASTAENVKVR